MGELELRKPELVPFVLNDIVLNDSCHPASHVLNVIIHLFLPLIKPSSDALLLHCLKRDEKSSQTARG
jgi:hypothetical protein